MSTDSELIAASGEDPDQFSEIFERHVRAVGGYIRRRIGELGVDDAEFDDWVVGRFDDPFSLTMMPAHLRAGMFRMLALVPGMEVTESDGALVTLTYQRGAGGVETFIIDTEQGLLRSSSTTYQRGGIAAGIPDSLHEIDVSVVDTAPEPTE